MLRVLMLSIVVVGLLCSCMSSAMDLAKSMQKPMIGDPSPRDLTGAQSRDSDFTDSTTVKINSVVDKNFRKPLETVVISLGTTDRESVYNVGLSIKTIDFATEIENAFKSEFAKNKVDSYIYKATSLTLDESEISGLIKKTGAKFVLQLNHSSSSTYDTLVISQKYDIFLIEIDGNKRFWRAQAEVKREAFSSGGLSEQSAIVFAKELVKTMKTDGVNF